MKLGDFYERAVEIGKSVDMRGEAALEARMEKHRKRFEKLDPREQRLFDQERLTNPFGDTRIVYGDSSTELGRVIISIDVDASTFLLASELSRRGKQVDAVIAHHGTAVCGVASREDTAAPLVYMATSAGVPEARAWQLVREMVGKEDNAWDLRIVQVAEALEIPLMTVHSPADGSVDAYLREQIAELTPATVHELVELIEAWPECQWLINRIRRSPWIEAGHRDAPLGRVFPDFYGGWGLSPALFEQVCKAGISTFVMMGCTTELKKLACKYGANIVVAPHYPADNVGINLLLDRIFPDGDEFDIVPAGNYHRHRRNS